MQDTGGIIGIRELLEAGVHFGHQAKRWNPKMKRYIFAERTGVHIIDLDQTLDLLDRSLNFVRSVAEANRDVLFVGTKKQAQITVAEEAIRSGQPYVAERYIGGMLTNFQTIKPRIEYFKGLSAQIEETPEENRSGKDWFALSKEYQKLRRNFAGLTEMERLPGAVFVLDPKREELLIKEANRLKIPVVALTDSNCDPEVVDYVIPGNDDAIRSISLISRAIADAVISGRGEDIVPAEDRPLPPAVEEALAAEEPPVSEAAEDTLEEGALQPESSNGASASIPETTNGSANSSITETEDADTNTEDTTAEAPDAEAPDAEASVTEEPEIVAEDDSSEAIAETPAEEVPADESAAEEEAEAKTGEVVDPAEVEGDAEGADDSGDEEVDVEENTEEEK